MSGTSRAACAVAVLFALLSPPRADAVIKLASSYGSPGNSDTNITAIAVDQAGNRLIAGTFTQPSFTLVDRTLIRMAAPGFPDLYVAKLDPAGNVLWAHNFGGPDAWATPSALKLDSAGNAYVAGNFRGGNLVQPPLTKISNGSTSWSDAFLIKLDSASGDVAWARNYGGALSSQTSATALLLDSFGGLFLGGRFDGPLTTPMLAQVDSEHGAWGSGFLFAINPGTGFVSSARAFGGPYVDCSILALAENGAGHVFVAGAYQAQVDHAMTQPPLPRIGAQDSFVLRFDRTSGLIDWANNFGGTNASVSIDDLVLDSTGHPLVAASLFFGDLTSPAVAKIGSWDALMLRMNGSTGSIEWAKAFGGSGAATSGTALVLDSDGHPLLTGGFFNANLTTPALSRIGDTDIMLLKVNAYTGVTIWARNYGGNGAIATGTGLAKNATGRLHVSGTFGNANLTSPALPKLGSSDAFILTPEPDLALIPPLIAFGSVVLGAPKPTQVVTVNNGPIPAYFDAGAITANSRFKVGAHTCPSVLEAAGTCYIPVTFDYNRSALESVSGTLSLDFGGSLPRSISLSGTTIAPEGGWLAEANGNETIQAPIVALGETFQFWPMLRNLGKTSLLISSTAATGAYEPDHLGGCAGSLEPNNTCQLPFVYRPTGTTGSMDGILTIHHSGANEPFDLAVSTPATELSAGRLTVAITPVLVTTANASTLTLTLSNTNAVPLQNLHVPVNLPFGLAIANPANASPGNCGGGWFPYDGGGLSGKQGVYQQGAQVPANGSCAMQIDIAAGNNGSFDINLERYAASPVSGGEPNTVTLFVGAKLLDIDGNGVPDPRTDGELIMRYLLGLRGNALTADVVGANPSRTQLQIARLLTSGLFDVDGNGAADALTDGLLIVRYLSGVRGNALINGAIGPSASRTTAFAVEAFLGLMLP